ncbi:MAG: hypothetical protein VB031_09490 [Eubacteriaceae bacterium]|nr:hypothetical protein [Eubacteriaceae bacterium]
MKIKKIVKITVVVITCIIALIMLLNPLIIIDGYDLAIDGIVVFKGMMLVYLLCSALYISYLATTDN